MNRKTLNALLYSLIVIFIFLLLYFLYPFSHSTRRACFPLVIVLGVLSFLIGIVILFIAKKRNGKIKIFLIITGLSAVSPFVFTILHNLFYGLGESFEEYKYLFQVLHITSFIISTIISPITLFAGTIGSLIILKKERPPF